MTQQIALNERTNDLIFNNEGGIERVIDGRYTIQLVRNRLMTVLGEWSLDNSIGWLNFKDFTKRPDLFNIEMKAREIILSTKGVQRINDITLKLDGRMLRMSFDATTDYGEIKLNVPWRL